MSKMLISNAGSLQQRTRNRDQRVAHMISFFHFSAAGTLFYTLGFWKSRDELKLELIKENIEKMSCLNNKLSTKKAEKWREKDELLRKHKLSGLVGILSPRWINSWKHKTLEMPVEKGLRSKIRTKHPADVTGGHQSDKTLTQWQKTSIMLQLVGQCIFVSVRVIHSTISVQICTFCEFMGWANWKLCVTSQQHCCRVTGCVSARPLLCWQTCLLVA